MAPEVGKTERATVTRSSVIRANLVQTTILKTAYALSNIATQEQLKGLSQATNLPEKWIHQWFGRQRVKDRKSKSKAAPGTAASVADSAIPMGSISALSSAADLSISISVSSSASMLIASNPDTILSAQEILQIKQEHHDPMPSSLLSEQLLVPIQAPAPPSELRDSSEALTAIPNVSVSSSSTLEHLPPASATSVSRSKRKGRAPQGPKQHLGQNTNENQKALATVRKTRRRGATRAARVKAEFVEPPVENITTPPVYEAVLDDASGPSTATKPTAGRGTRVGTRPSVTDYTQLLPMIGPPKRSSFSQARNTEGSNLRVLQSIPVLTSSDNVYLISQAEAHNPRADSSLQSANTSTRSALHTQDIKPSVIPQRLGYLEGQGPVFRSTQFYNQGPWSFASSSVLVSSRPASNVAGASRRTQRELTTVASDPPVPPLQYLYEWPDSNNIPRLALAFDWESRIPPEPEVPVSSLARNGISQYQQSEAPQAEAVGYVSREYCVENQERMSVHPLEESSSRALLYSPLELSGFDSFLTGTVLDPSLAPLKHLTDILENFKDEQGTYMPLMQQEQHERLMGCLLDERLAERSPFQAAMGLSLLSKLGVEWEV